MNSLRTRLLILVALSLAPAVLLGIYNGVGARHEAIQAAERTLQQVADLAAANEAQTIGTGQQLLRDLSDLPELFETSDRCDAVMRKALQRNPQYANLGLVQLNGDVTCSAVASATVVNLADRAHFRTAVAERRFVVGGYVFGRVIQKHTINLTYPVTDASGAVLAVLFASLDLTALDKFINDVKLPQGAYMLTVDAQGLIASRRPDAERWLGRPVEPELLQAIKERSRVPREIVGADGVERLHAFAPIGAAGSSNLMLSVAIPTEQIVAPAAREQLRTSIVLALTAALALLAAWFAAEHLIVRRVMALVATAEKISSGDFQARTGIAYDKEEIGSLARAIDEMAASLGVQADERDQAEDNAQAAHNELMLMDRRKDEFLAMLAHELRNPLAPIRNAAHVLRMMPGSETRVQATGELIARQVDHMTALVDDLLDVSRVTRGLVTLQMEALDLNDIVAKAVEQTRPAFDAARHVLAVQPAAQPAVVQGDATRLVQVVANILHNAAKYTPEGGQASISVESVPGHWEIHVRDNGNGISPDLLPRVFELFSQGARTPHRTQGGLGLGLALVKRLVELHDGKVRARSAGEGQGAEFTISLPAVDRPAADAAAVPQGQEPLTQRAGLTVMVIDDNHDAADTTAMLLDALGFRTVVEYSAQAALTRAAEVAPDVCLLDIGLPDLDGYQLVGKLRRIAQTRHVVMIAVTGYGHDDDKAKAIAAGFDYYLVKPVDPAVLTQLLADITA